MKNISMATNTIGCLHCEADHQTLGSLSMEGKKLVIKSHIMGKCGRTQGHRG